MIAGHLADKLAGVPPWQLATGLALHFALGIVAGTAYFHALFWNVRMFTKGARWPAVVGVSVGRFALLASLLVLASFEGALPLLLTALGLLIARRMVMRQIGGFGS